ncbi:hypothetical protein ADILRU_0985 [Leifsonia rubra CMS 76R]|nr:hypothetical protein ADILRU_0985 [Leifsonia rubra CMS 76R]
MDLGDAAADAGAGRDYLSDDVVASPLAHHELTHNQSGEEGSVNFRPKTFQSVGKREQARPHFAKKCWSDLLFLVRPEGFEPPTY